MAAKTLEQRVQETIGAQALTIMQVQAENELLHERIKELEAAAAEKKDG